MSTNLSIVVPLHGISEVTDIHRKDAFVWTAEIAYRYQGTSWHERITFTVGDPDPDGIVPITVTDTDFPDDRALVIRVSQHADMVTVIADFILSGRW